MNGVRSSKEAGGRVVDSVKAGDFDGIHLGTLR